jgi:hypothetical protein
MAEMRPKRLVRVADFTAETLDEEANKMPPSYKEQAEILHRMADNFRRSENPKMIWVWEEVTEEDAGKC